MSVVKEGTSWVEAIKYMRSSKSMEKNGQSFSIKNPDGRLLSFAWDYNLEILRWAVGRSEGI